MYLIQEDIELFFKLWCGLVYGVNEKHKIIPHFEKPVYGKSMPREPFIEVRKTLWDNLQWIEEFLCDSGGEFTEIERDILASWGKYAIKNTFVILKHLAKYSVFMTMDADTKLYGVVGISNPIQDMLFSDVPLVTDAVLLPFKDHIITDGFLEQHRVLLGKGIRDSLGESYRKAKEKSGILLQLGGAPATPVAPRKPKEKEDKPVIPVYAGDMPPELKDLRLPKTMIPRYLEISEIITSFCSDMLDEEYKELCLYTLAKLCRKRPSPLESGRANTWACGIIYAIGSNNFLFDRSQKPYVPPAEIAAWFGLSKSTAGNKGAEVKNILNINYFSAEYCLKSKLADNSAIWFLSVNGWMTDIRQAPRELQEMAFAKGLIPYIPADME